MAAVTTTNRAIAATEKKVVEEKTACENEVKGTDAWLALIEWMMSQAAQVDALMAEVGLAEPQVLIFLYLGS